MRPRAFSLPHRLGLTWLVWLALLLPVSQSVAAWHEFSHLRHGVGARIGDPGPLHEQNCDLCLAAAAVDHGGMPVASVGLPLLQAVSAPPVLASVASATLPPVRRYLSRAPPAFLR